MIKLNQDDLESIIWMVIINVLISLVISILIKTPFIFLLFIVFGIENFLCTIFLLHYNLFKK